jgi:hypothetical protein
MQLPCDDDELGTIIGELAIGQSVLRRTRVCCGGTAAFFDA